MIRIEELKDGVLHIQYPLSDKYEAELDKVEEAIREKIYMLRAADVHTYLVGIGARMDDNKYWLFENNVEEVDFLIEHRN